MWVCGLGGVGCYGGVLGVRAVATCVVSGHCAIAVVEASLRHWQDPTVGMAQACFMVNTITSEHYEDRADALRPTDFL